MPNIQFFRTLITSIVFALHQDKALPDKKVTLFFRGLLAHPLRIFILRWLLLRKREINGVTPAKAGVQDEKLDSRFRGNDKYSFCNKNSI